MHRADRVRNVALVGHRGSGKTSLNEALLYQAGAINRLGSVTEGTTASDSDPDEQARQMSISASLSSFEWDERKINLIDTPGEPSFVADAMSALRVCESAIFVVNAVMGVEVNTQRPEGIGDEAGLARRVEHVDLLVLPFERGEARADRHLARLLVGGRVGHRGPVDHAAQAVDGTGLEQQGLVQRGLAAPAVPD